jgi:hypothetical protein
MILRWFQLHDHWYHFRFYLMHKVIIVVNIIIVIIIILISHFSALAGEYSPILECIINRIRLGVRMCNV